MSSGMTMTQRYPRTAQIIARLMPVLPLVASTTVEPGTSSPDSSAAKTIESAGRSFTEPAMLFDSSFPQTSAPLSPRDSCEPHQRRVADQVERAVIDSFGHVAASIPGSG